MASVNMYACWRENRLMEQKYCHKKHKIRKFFFVHSMPFVAIKYSFFY
jgi:hypothetical protein